MPDKQHFSMALWCYEKKNLNATRSDYRKVSTNVERQQLFDSSTHLDSITLQERPVGIEER